MSGSEDFLPPEISLGDLILYHSNPQNPQSPNMGWVPRRPGKHTISCLVFTENAGFVEKPSVRHLSDPGLQDNADWRQAGAWELHPTTETLRKFKSLLPRIVGLLDRKDSK